MQDLAEDEDGALAGRETLERRDEREPDRLAGDGDLGRVATGDKDALVGHRLDPRRLRQGLAEERDVSHARRPEVHRPDPPFAPLERVEADVRRDPVEPRAQAGPSLEAPVTAPSA